MEQESRISRAPKLSLWGLRKRFLVIIVHLLQDQDRLMDGNQDMLHQSHLSASIPFSIP